MMYALKEKLQNYVFSINQLDKLQGLEGGGVEGRRVYLEMKWLRVK